MDRTVVHFEIPADDPERAVDFYGSLFGWDIYQWKEGEGAAEDYWMVSTVPIDGERHPLRPWVNGGIVRRRHPAQGPVNYVKVESIDQFVSDALGLGAELVKPKTPVARMGWLALLKDTEGNVFGLWQAIAPESATESDAA